MEVTDDRYPCNLPPEIWEDILSYLNQPSDLLSVMRTCTQLQRLLEPKRTLVLFQNAFPVFAKYIPENDALTCRLICKPLKATVDGYQIDCNKILMENYYERSESWWNALAMLFLLLWLGYIRISK